MNNCNRASPFSMFVWWLITSATIYNVHRMYQTIQTFMESAHNKWTLRTPLAQYPLSWIMAGQSSFVPASNLNMNNPARFSPQQLSPARLTSSSSTRTTTRTWPSSSATARAFCTAAPSPSSPAPRPSMRCSWEGSVLEGGCCWRSGVGKVCFSVCLVGLVLALVVCAASVADFFPVFFSMSVYIHPLYVYIFLNDLNLILIVISIC